jgi:putative Mn2+ efflux pump MntP
MPDRSYVMNPIALLLLAFAMSTDAFAAAIGKGASLKNPRFPEALRIGLIFGLVETITPLIGWVIGKSASSYVEAWDHWIAFSLLLALGLHMIYEGLKPDEPGVEKPNTQSFFKLCLTAVGTSIDAMAVGVGLAFIDVNIWLAAALIGLATTVMVTLGVMLGRVVGSVLGHRAEIFGGLTLIAVGGWILSSHL